MHAEYDESLLPIPPERGRLRPNRVGKDDPPIRDGKKAIAFMSHGLYFYDVTVKDGRLVLLEPGTDRVVMDFWKQFCPEEAI